MSNEFKIIIEITYLLQELEIKDYWLRPEALVEKDISDLKDLRHQLANQVIKKRLKGEYDECFKKNDQAKKENAS